MKVLHVLNSNKFSGAENVVCQIINMFENEKDIEMVYCSPKGPIEKTLKEKQVPYHMIDRLSVKNLRKVIALEKPTFIHAHDMKASFIVSLSCSNIPFVSHIHNSAFDSRVVSAKSIAFLMAGMKAKSILWVSNSAYQYYIFHNLFKNKSEILMNILDVNQLVEKASNDSKSYSYDVVYCGRLSEPKNPKRLIDICRLLADKRNDVNIAIIGTGDLDDDIRRYAKEKKLKDNVSFLGFINNPYKIIKDSKCMIMTSKQEGTPMAVLESLALGVPVVSTPVDGVLELIKNGENGFLSSDNLEFAEYVIQILQDNELHKKLSEFSKQSSKEYNNISRYKTVLKKVYSKV